MEYEYLVSRSKLIKIFEEWLTKRFENFVGTQTVEYTREAPEEMADYVIRKLEDNE